MYIEHSRVYLDPSGKNTYLYSCYCCFFLFLAKECRLNHLLLLRGSQIIILKPLFPTLIVQIMCPSSAIKILIIKKLFSDSSLCWLVTNKQKKRVHKHLMIDLLWMTIHLDINNRKPYHFGVGVKSQKQCAQGSSKTL